MLKSDWSIKAARSLSQGVERLSAIGLDIRCVSCANELRITKFLAGHGLLGDEIGQCKILSCFKPAWHKSKYCQGHFHYGTP
jgi:hypothetical protein